MAEDQKKEGVADQQQQSPPKVEETTEKGFGLSSYGNSAGDKVQSTLGVVGNPLGKGLAGVAAPLGGAVGSVVDNGIMLGGRTAGGMTGQGAGGMDTEEYSTGWKDLKEQKKSDDEMHEPIGGKDQTGENPLGL